MDAKNRQPSLFGPHIKISRKDSKRQYAFSSESKNDERKSDESTVSDLLYSCCVKPSPRKGLGVFATEDIPAGEAILIEKPSLVHGPLTEEEDNKFWCNPELISSGFENIGLVEDFMKLPKGDQSDIMSLYNGFEKQFPSRKWSPGKRPNGRTLVGKFLTNRLRISPKLTGICFRCAIINHSCDSNCTLDTFGTDDSIDGDNRWVIIESRRDIAAGDEITIPYHNFDGSCGERHDFMLRWYGFKCACDRCAKDLEKMLRIYPTYPTGYNSNYARNPLNSQKVELQQSKLVGLPGGLQGRNMLTVVKAIAGGIHTIPKNGIVLKETPLMLITKEELRIISRDSGQPRQDYHPMITRFLQLSADSRNEFLALSNWRRDSSINNINSLAVKDSMPSPRRLLEIWMANCFALDGGMEGVFPTISNINHSCSPNCRVFWNPEQKILSLIAIELIKVGDRITICYNHDLIHKIHVERRRKYLKENYGFHCCCTRCIEQDVNTERNSSLQNLSNLQPHPTPPYKLSESLGSSGETQIQRLVENRRPGQISGRSEGGSKDYHYKGFEEKTWR